jgi:uridine kinase
MNLIEVLSDLCSQSPRPIITIDGPAGAGKTTLAKDLSLALSTQRKVQVLHMDDLYDGWERALGGSLTETLTRIVAAHKEEASYAIALYNWEKSEFNPPLTLDPAEILILEGVGSGQRAIRSAATASIWMDIEPSQGLDRVLLRDGITLQDKMQKWLIAQKEHFRQESTFEESDFVLTS